MNDFTHDNDMLPEGPEYGNSEPSYRQLPHSIESEKALLGALMTDNKIIERISDALRGEHFAVPEHGKLFDVMKEAIGAGRMVDPVTLAGTISDENGLITKTYLVELACSVVTLVNAGEYARIIYDLHKRRELIHIGQNIVNCAYDQNDDVPIDGHIENAESELSDLAGDSVSQQMRGRGEVIMDVLKDIEDRKKHPGRLLGHSTGLVQLDRVLRGLRDTDLIIIAGRPSMGKTVLATTIAYNCAQAHQRSGGEEGAPVLFFSLEMSAEQLYERLFASTSNVPADFMETGKYYDDRQFSDVVEAGQNLINVPLFVDDRGGMTVARMKAHALRMKRKWGIGAIVVDYLQLIDAPHGKSDGRVNEVSAMTKALKNMAKELQVPVILLSQLSRAVEQRDPPVPRMADLRDSGSIEQDADVVMFIYRPEYYLERKEPRQRQDEDASKFALRMDQWQDQMKAAKGIADALIEKNRKGRTGKVTLAFHPGYQRFANLEIHEEDRS